MFGAALLALGTLLCASPPAGAAAPFDDKLLCGEWANVESHWFRRDRYQYLRINDDFSGVFYYFLGKGEPVVLRFTAEQVRHEEGVMVISRTRPGTGTFKLVLSGTAFGEVTGLITGTLYLYIEDRTRTTLLDSLPVRVSKLAPTGLGTGALPTVRELRKALRH